MSSVKSRLKASRDAIQAKDWTKGAEEAQEALKLEPDNYNALVFRGLALLQLQRFDESEESYRSATKVQPTQQLAWQGLEKFYSERKLWDKQAKVLSELMNIASEAEDATKCAEALQRLLTLQRAEGSRSQIASTLSCYLPTSVYHTVLRKLPRPDQTNPETTTTFESEMAIHIQSLSIIEEIIRLTEEAESIAIEKEIDKKRMRLDSANKSKETIRYETSIDIWRNSKLPELYELILAHVDASDEQRRDAEHKLLFFRYHFLQALPNSKAKIAGPGNTAAKQDTLEMEDEQSKEKNKALLQLLDQAAGIVTINVPEELAWNVTLEWHNIFSPAELKLHQLRAYVDHFPRSGLTHSFKALLYVLGDEQFLKEERERFEKHDVDVPRPDDDVLSLAIVGIQESSQSILAHRIAACLYLQERDWLSCSDVATNGLNLAKEAENTFSVDLSKIKAGLESSLATALTHLFPPQHHARALRLADAVLSKEEGNIEATLCKAYISQTAGNWKQARALYAYVQNQSEVSANPDRLYLLQKLCLSKSPAREARLEVAWCDVKLGRLEEGKASLRAVVEELDADPDSGSEDQAKAWWRLGSCLWQMGGAYQEEVTEAFTCFITSLKRNPSYAPAFTSLGFYYKEVSNPFDLVRAAKCFQKAFELDASENEAAFQLAQSYADDDDWDLVYLVAQRAIEGEGGGEALSGEIKSQRRHVTHNAWAWTAIGSTELLREKYEKAITAFQIALRSFPHDGEIWMKLGEAYTSSGRLTAGIKAFEKSFDILKDTKDCWQPRFNIAQIQKQQGLHAESLEILLQLREQEPGLQRITVACAESRLLLALEQIRNGYAEGGSSNLYTAMLIAQEVVGKDDSLLAAWKVLADGLSQCASMYLDGEMRVSLQVCLRSTLNLTDKYKVDSSLPSISAVTRATIDAEGDGKLSFLLSSIYLHKLRVLLHHDDEQVAGSVWMDLGVNLHRLSAVPVPQGRHDERRTIKSQAIACVKEALKMEPGNGTYWSALGTLVFHTSVRLAQHCYSKAIECDAGDAVPWTSLGFLYLQNDDIALARESFVKAQTLDPDCVEVWIGHALLAKKQGRQGNGKKLYQHAYEIDEGNSSLEAGYGYASSLLRNRTPITRSELSTASFALSSYLTQRPDDFSALHLHALFAERLNELDSAIEHIQRASSILETQYEEDESTEKARLFAVCMVNLGRIRLKRGDEASAKESFEMALGLLTAGEGEEESGKNVAEESQGHFSEEDLRRARLGAHCGNGVAQFAIGQEQDAVAELTQTLEAGGDIEEGDEESQEQLCLLLARMLWIDENQQEAESYVMEALSARPQSARALLTLGTIACLNKDGEQLELVNTELQQLLQSPHGNSSGSGSSSSSSDESAITAFLASMKLHQGKVQEAVQILKRSASTSLASQGALTRLLLTLALQSSPNSLAVTSSADRAEPDTNTQPQQALVEALRLVKIAEQDAALHDEYLIDSLRLASIALTLVGRKDEAVDMATRCAALQPSNLTHWSLLQIIHHLTK